MRRLAMSFAVAAWLQGCAMLQVEDEASRHVHEVVGEAVSASQASPAEQRRRLSSALRQYDSVPNEQNGVRYALLLATLPPPLGDDARAAAVLGPIGAKRPATPLSRLASLFAVTAADRHRLARELRAAEERAAGAAQRAESAGQRAESAERREEAANERARQLQGQLEALKQIERTILQREDRRRTPKR